MSWTSIEALSLLDKSKNRLIITEGFRKLKPLLATYMDMWLIIQPLQTLCQWRFSKVLGCVHRARIETT